MSERQAPRLRAEDDNSPDPRYS